MPELCDVEGFRRYFRRHATGRRVRAVEASAPEIVRNTSPQGLGRALRDRVFVQPERVGKWLLAPTDGPVVVLIHFGMTGGLEADHGSNRHPHDRVVLMLDDGELRYRDQRKLGGVWLARDHADVVRVTGPLGPDALGLDTGDLDQIVSRSRGSLKAALMNQRRIAGIGNELSDEILWQARLHPRRRGRSLDARDRRALYRSMRTVLRDSARLGHIPRRRSWLSSQRGVRNPACPRCRTRVERSRIGGRTSYWCPRCQPEPG